MSADAAAAKTELDKIKRLSRDITESLKRDGEKSLEKQVGRVGSGQPFEIIADTSYHRLVRHIRAVFQGQTESFLS